MLEEERERRHKVRNNNNVNNMEVRKKNLTEGAAVQDRERYNLRPRKKQDQETRPTSKVKSDQARNSRGENYRPYIREQTRSRSRKTNNKEILQKSSQEMRRGEKKNITLSLEALVGNAKP
ncbi:hypothetical protein TNIN_428061 [Trichonephila inaurata madagascariensis]|uniref:Uncharacterized protein n=1 Tax=Trichonephila inaurata madagascariensis TaxID=2747483 RepID=A0A8X6WSJ5_9ARAC|nr:hypothetical protein TNIN_428061 [Trichonephila inaurata madagascariensis]